MVPRLKVKDVNLLILKHCPEGQASNLTHCGTCCNTCRDRDWQMPSLHSPVDVLQNTSISQKGAFTHAHLPIFYGCTTGDASWSPGSGGQGRLHSWSYQMVITNVTQIRTQTPVWYPNFSYCCQGTPLHCLALVASGVSTHGVSQDYN